MQACRDYILCRCGLLCSAPHWFLTICTRKDMAMHSLSNTAGLALADIGHLQILLNAGANPTSEGLHGPPRGDWKCLLVTSGRCSEARGGRLQSSHTSEDHLNVMERPCRCFSKPVAPFRSIWERSWLRHKEAVHGQLENEASEERKWHSSVQ